MMPRLVIGRLLSVVALAVAGVILAVVLIEQMSAPQSTLADVVRPVNAAGKATAPTTINFNKQIRPILSDRCFKCHGPDINKRISGLRLDKQVEAFGPLPKHPNQHAFVPGHPEQSLAYLRIISGDASEVMPPPAAHLKVDAQEKALIKQWIMEGAHWQEHWAFVKPARLDPPEVVNKAWPRNEIDHFILARLEQEGVQPSPEADKATLIRRVSLDLTGIPPTPAEVDAFVADQSANAYEKVVDRLLASPRYGEQMAAPWLDYARYADSHGFQADPERFMWHWRDWVLNAYNSNMPFDEFTIEQLAGDMLPNATDDQKIATGFNRNHRINGEGGIIAEEWRIEGVIDRVETTSGTWLGLTMGCCRCHDHKFDPITQKEFYAFSGFFNSINEQGGVIPSNVLDAGNNAPPFIKVFSAEQKKRFDELTAEVAAADVKLKPFQERLPALEKALQASGGVVAQPAGLAVRFPLDGKPDGVDGAGKPIAATVEGAGTFVQGRYSKAFKADGQAAAIKVGDAVGFERNEAVSYGAWVKFEGGGAVIARMDAAMAERGFDIYVMDNKIAAHIIHHWPDNALKVVTEEAFPKDQWFHVMVTYDGSSKAAGMHVYVDGRDQPVVVEADSLTDTVLANVPFAIARRSAAHHFDGEVADVRFYKRTLRPDEVSALATGPAVEAITKIPAAKRKPAQKAELAELLLGNDPEFAKANAEIVQARKELKKIDRGPSAGGPDTTMVMEELPKPRDTYLLIRGQYDAHGEKVQPGIPAIFPQLSAGVTPNRLALARWIVSPDNPLTARVQVNRFWEKFFGMGLVKTSENLGTQSEWPSHPELLDWLATEFMRLKWDMKAIQKEIVMSATYRQASTERPELLERDPENRMISRMSRLRLPAETVRDQALAISGLLVEKIGGPSVKPYAPANLWAGNNFGNLSKYVQDTGESLYRRSLYTFWKRTAAPPNLLLFDMPSREYCVMKRSRTDTPLQALDVLNDPTYMEASRKMAEHMMEEGGSTPTQRITYGFRRALCRPPTDIEAKLLLTGFEKQLARYGKDHDAALKLVSVGDSPRNTKLDVSELAAYTMSASVILNLDEMITRQ
jgi:hypothetical protein